MAKQIQLDLEIGANFSATVTLDTTQTGRTHRAHIRETASATTVKLAFTTASGIALAGDTVTLTAGADVTELLNLATDSALWVIDIESVGATAADVRREARGQVLVTRDITRTSEATPAASALGFVAYSEPQTLTAPQQLIARTNIGAGTGGATDAVLYTAQTLTGPQQVQATTNIDAATATALASGLAGKAATSHTHLLAAGATDVSMTAANLNTLDDGVTTALHFHDSDRARGNHTGTQAASTIGDSTVAGRAILTAADASAQRTALGLGTAATTATSDYATAAQGTNDRTASGLRNATTVVSVSAGAAPSAGQTLTATSGTAATWQTPGGGASTVTTRTTTGTITVPAWAVTYRCEIFGMGGPGGSGRKGAAASVACGGGGGGGGQYVSISGAASELGGSVACIVPAGAAGGAAQTIDDANGNGGDVRADTSAMLGDFLFYALGGINGSGGTASAGAGGSQVSRQLQPASTGSGVSGGNASASGGVGANGNTGDWTTGGGGAGGGITSGNAASAGGAGGICAVFNTEFAGGLAGAIGAAGSAAAAVTGFHGAGGAAGGGSALTGAAGAGANGIGYGGAGGGGGAARNGGGNSSGAGGNGAAGAVRMTFFP